MEQRLANHMDQVEHSDEYVCLRVHAQCRLNLMTFDDLGARSAC